MKQTDKWELMYLQVIGYLYTHKRRPSKYREEDHRMVNWLKYNRKLIARGELPQERVERFNSLLTLCDKYQRINQNAYVDPEAASDVKQQRLDFKS